jgi:hypothetical protein
MCVAFMTGPLLKSFRGADVLGRYSCATYDGCPSLGCPSAQLVKMGLELGVPRSRIGAAGLAMCARCVGVSCTEKADFGETRGSARLAVRSIAQVPGKRPAS